jgi:hypothetical protein
LSYWRPRSTRWMCMSFMRNEIRKCFLLFFPTFAIVVGSISVTCSSDDLGNLLRHWS